MNILPIIVKDVKQCKANNQKEKIFFFVVRNTLTQLKQTCGLYYTHVHGQTILAMKNICNLWEKTSFIFYLHSQMSVKMDIWLRYKHLAVDLRFITQKSTFHGHLPVNDVFIRQAPGLNKLLVVRNKTNSFVGSQNHVYCINHLGCNEF